MAFLDEQAVIQSLNVATPCSSPWQRLGKGMWLTQDPAVRAVIKRWHDSCLLMLCLMLLQSVPLCYPGTVAFSANLDPAWQEVGQLSAGMLCVQEHC